jgi:hypothetical protein
MTEGVFIVILLAFIGWKLEQMHKYKVDKDIDKEIKESGEYEDLG